MALYEDGRLPEYLVLDGGLGTTVAQVCDDEQAVNTDPLWSSRFLQANEEIFKNIHREFLDAGADVLMTNTYKPSVENLMDNMPCDRQAALQMFQKSVTIAKEVVDNFWRNNETNSRGRRRPLVVGAMGPYGARTFTGSEYTGTYVETTTIEEMVKGHKEKAQSLLEGGVDILAFETIPAVKEVEAIVSLMKLFPGAHAWVTFSCKDGEHTCHGERISDAVLATLASDAIVGVGVNCGGPQYVESLLQHIPNAVKQQKKIVVYPNNGQVWDKKAKRWYGDSDVQAIHEYVPRWLELGAQWIGGCCNVSPDHIKLIKKEMDQYLSGQSNVKLNE